MTDEQKARVEMLKKAWPDLVTVESQKFLLSLIDEQAKVITGLEADVDFWRRVDTKNHDEIERLKSGNYQPTWLDEQRAKANVLVVDQQQEITRLRAALAPFVDRVKDRGNLRGTGNWSFSIPGDVFEDAREALAGAKT